MKIKYNLFAVMLFLTITSIFILIFTASASNIDSTGQINSQSIIDNVILSSTETLTETVYLPLISKPIPPLFLGMTVRWDSVGYSRGSEVWDAGYHRIRNLDMMTDSDTIRSNNHGWYSPNPWTWPDEYWYSYYSVSTLQFKASSSPPDPDWKWGAVDWILPFSVVLSNNITIMIDRQAFIVSGPYSGYTTFGKAVQYWQLTNRDKFLLWDDGGDWKVYIHPGEYILRYDAGSTRLLIYNNELRHYYYQGNLTSDTMQWIENLSSSNSWPASGSVQQDLDIFDNVVNEKQSLMVRLQQERGRGEMHIIP